MHVRQDCWRHVAAGRSLTADKLHIYCSTEGQALEILHTFPSAIARGRQMLSSRSSSSTSSLENYKATKTDEKHQPVGAAVYEKFDRQVRDLDKQLRKLCKEARLLGSAAGILSASTHLRERLSRVLHLFCQNAHNLYPEEIQAYVRAQAHSAKPLRRPRDRHPILDRLHKFASTEPRDTDDMAAEFRMFSRDVKTLFRCFSQVPEFVQELPDQTISEELETWAKSLDNFERELGNLAVQTYLYDSMADIGDRLETLATEFIQAFKEIGIPAIQATQDHAISNVQNQTVVSTLFASAATSMIQVYSGNGSDTALNGVVILLWYMTLLFSIGSTVNGVLGLSWVQATYRSPSHLVPWWIIVWIKSFPLIFLVLAVACSFVALTLFAFSPGQSVSTLVIITSFSVSSCVGLLLVSSWFSGEWLIFVQNDGRIWLADGIESFKRGVIATMRELWARSWAKSQGIMAQKSGETDAEQGIQSIPIGARPPLGHASTTVDFWAAHDRNLMKPSEKARHRWHEAVRRVIHDQRKIAGRRVTPSDRSQFAHLLLSLSGLKSVPKLRSMTITGEHRINEAHNALVRCIQFSPEGQYLVTSSWDSHSLLFRIGTPVLCERVLDHPHGTGYVHQVNWSPDGTKLLMRSTQSLIVWDFHQRGADGVFHQGTQIFIHKPDQNDRMIHGASWNGNGSRFFSLQGRRVLTMDTSSTIWHDYPTQHLELHSVCVTSDSKWMICVGKYKKDHQHIGKRYGIIVWNLQHRVVAKHVPVFYEINDVALASDDKSVLVSYANKSPSQLWQLYTNDSNVDFTLRHSYMPTDKTPFAALPSIYGGEHDHLVLRVGTVGHIFFWERDTATMMLYCIRAPSTLQGCITSFAWNRGSAKYMFAMGTRDGTIHIWTEGQHASNEGQDDHPQQAPIYGEQLTYEPRRWSTGRASMRRQSTDVLTSSSSSTIQDVTQGSYSSQSEYPWRQRG
ncbi:hypothetical protein BC629DRAFT_484921 [Irpex lacteus]|nr:hypothetical protein BC629DRAFT_484921 [Irpex lacteus]